MRNKGNTADGRFFSSLSGKKKRLPLARGQTPLSKNKYSVLPCAETYINYLFRLGCQAIFLKLCSFIYPFPPSSTLYKPHECAGGTRSAFR